MAELTLFGKLMEKALQQRTKELSKRYALTRLAKEAGIYQSHLWRACRGLSGISATEIHRVCDALHCSTQMRQALLNAAGYASQTQIEEAETYLQTLASESDEEDEEPDQEPAALNVGSC